MRESWGLSKELDRETLRSLVVHKKLSDRKIADIYNVTPATIRYHRLHADPPIMKESSTVRIDHRADGAIPWVLDVAQGHPMDPMARLLRARNRLRHGMHVDADMRARIDELERHLAEKDRVVNYNREIGFHTVRRDPDLDTPETIVRVPGQAEPRRG